MLELFLMMLIVSFFSCLGAAALIYIAYFVFTTIVETLISE